MAAIIAVRCGNYPLQSGFAIYDHSESQYFNFYLNENSDINISVYDYQKGNYIQGPLNSLYDYSSSTFMSLEIKRNTFQGYDYETNSYITGYVDNNVISIYDYQTSSYYYYTF